MPRPQKHVFVCVQQRPPTHPKGSCAGRGSIEVLQEFAEQFERRNLFGKLAVTSTGCLGPCDLGANVLVYPDGVLYAGVTKEDVATIVQEHLLGGEPVQRLLIDPRIWS
jgi:(2Fe-2S) ferredoxin